MKHDRNIDCSMCMHASSGQGSGAELGHMLAQAMAKPGNRASCVPVAPHLHVDDGSDLRRVYVKLLLYALLATTSKKKNFRPLDLLLVLWLRRLPMAKYASVRCGERACYRRQERSDLSKAIRSRLASWFAAETSPLWNPWCST